MRPGHEPSQEVSLAARRSKFQRFKELNQLDAARNSRSSLRFIIARNAPRVKES
jgi:hypothetical protein